MARFFRHYRIFSTQALFLFTLSESTSAERCPGCASSGMSSASTTTSMTISMTTSTDGETNTSTPDLRDAGIGDGQVDETFHCDICLIKPLMKSVSRRNIPMRHLLDQTRHEVGKSMRHFTAIKSLSQEVGKLMSSFLLAGCVTVVCIRAFPFHL